MVFLDAQEAYVDSRTKVLQLVLIGREFFLEHLIVVCFPDPTTTDVQDRFPQVAQKHGFSRVELFFMSSFLFCPRRHLAFSFFAQFRQRSGSSRF
jgi:hypothetical protein